MKKIILSAMLFLIVGCAGNGIKEYKTETYQFVIIKIDGCQYLRNTYSAAAPLTHKGNCNNPIHNLKTR